MNHARCRQYIAMHFGEEAAENVLVYEDEGFSGGNLERPQFKKMMKDSQKIAFAAIVVYRLDCRECFAQRRAQAANVLAQFELISRVRHKEPVTVPQLPRL